MNHEIDYQQALIKEVVTSRGIKAFLFDLDDTLVDTNTVFKNRMGKFSDDAAHMSGREGVITRQILRQALDGLRDHLGLDHDLMAVAAHNTLRNVGLDPDSHHVSSIIAELLEIYTGKDYQKFHGVEETLNALHGTGADTYIVTHASTVSTQGKLRAARLTGRFKGVFCIDPRGKKDEYAWRSVINDQLQLQPEQVFVTGDSWTSDIAPAVAVGVPLNHILRIRTEHNYSNNGVVAGVQEADSVRDLPQYLLRLL